MRGDRPLKRAANHTTTPAVGAVRFAAMKLLRRALLALSLASILAGGLRLRGKGGVPPQQGGWRELRVPRS